MTNLESILKSRHITADKRSIIVKAVVFPVVTCRYESWTIKKVECQKIGAFKLCAGEDSCESLGQQGDQTSLS